MIHVVLVVLIVIVVVAVYFCLFLFIFVTVGQRWLTQPLRDREAVQQRLDAVEEIANAMVTYPPRPHTHTHTNYHENVDLSKHF